MTLPPFVYTLAFWQSLTYVIAALVAYFTPYKLETGVLLVLILAILKVFDIEPQIRKWKLNRMLEHQSGLRTPPE